MNPEETQQPDMTPDESAAALSFATMLAEGQMPKMAPEESMEEGLDAPVSPETAPEEEIVAPVEESIEEPVEESPEPEDEVGQKVEALSKDLASFKGEVKGIIETKLGDLTDSIKDALKQE